MTTGIDFLSSSWSLNPHRDLSTRKLLLESAKHNVLTAHSAKEGEEMFKRFPNVDAVVVDSGLKDKRRLAKQVKERNRDIRIICLAPQIGATAAWADATVARPCSTAQDARENGRSNRHLSSRRIPHSESTRGLTIAGRRRVARQSPKSFANCGHIETPHCGKCWIIPLFLDDRQDAIAADSCLSFAAGNQSYAALTGLPYFCVC